MSALATHTIAKGVAALREMQGNDDRFVYSSWLQDHLKSARWVHRKQLPIDVYYAGHRQVIDALIRTCPPIVACNPEHPDQIYGFVCGGPGRLHYVYVKGVFRGVGIGRELAGVIRLMGATEGQTLPCSHWSPLASSNAQRWQIHYDPYWLVRDAAEGWER